MIFRKKKYYYNPATIAFEEIKIARKRRIIDILSFISICLSLTLFSGFLLNQLLGSHEARILENQVSSLDREMQCLLNKGLQLSSSLQNDLFVKDNHYRAILQIDTLPYSQRIAGSGGSAAENSLALQNNISYKVDNMIKTLNLQVRIESRSLEMLYEKAMDHSLQQTHCPAISPVEKNDLIMVSSDFGVRSDPFFFVERVHTGLDFVAPVGTNVYATGDGIVTFVQYSRTGYGNEIVVDHKFGFRSRYGHLNDIKVKEREKIKRGQIIGTVGKTGRSTGPHLHYEVLYKNKPVNPSFYFDTSLTREEYAQILNRAGKDTD